MNIRISHLTIRTRQTVELLHFSEAATFLFGPVGTGKSTVARLIDYCLGGDLENTPAIQQEFVAVSLGAVLGDHECTLERGARDRSSVRVTWANGEEDIGSVDAPLAPSDMPLIDAAVYNLSDLLFHLCGVEPIKVPRRSLDPESPTVRLSFRDIWWYCYLDQTHLDSSFFRLEDTFRGRKSQDAMRFFTGLHSEKLSQLQADLYRTIAEQQGSREAVAQIRTFMNRFEFGGEQEIADQIGLTDDRLRVLEQQRTGLERERQSSLHPTDTLRQKLRELGQLVSDLSEAVDASEEALKEQAALRAELITTKVKANRSEQAGSVLTGVEYESCPQCGSSVSERTVAAGICRLCGSHDDHDHRSSGIDFEVIRRELNDRIDQIGDSLNRRSLVLEQTKRQLRQALAEKSTLDSQLEQQLAQYDSAYVESIRAVDREVATLQERRRSLSQLSEMPRAVGELEVRAGALQGLIDQLRTSWEGERQRLRVADDNAEAIAQRFKAIMLAVGFPGVTDDDEVLLDPRSWKPKVVHRGHEWGFWDTGSGGKKTLFNVCYALALHEVARLRHMPVPSVLIIDSPTKNISEDENPDLVKALYREIYRVAANGGTQFILIDSELVEPESVIAGISHRRLAGEPEAPSLISYYEGP